MAWAKAEEEESVVAKLEREVVVLARTKSRPHRVGRGGGSDVPLLARGRVGGRRRQRHFTSALLDQSPLCTHGTNADRALANSHLAACIVVNAAEYILIRRRKLTM